MRLETIIGLEIHLQLKTKSKMFCACNNAGENEPPNTTVCPICLGHPGTLPTLNMQAVKYGLQLALALDCSINQSSKFDRKNYFYPDLAKGYQISQFDLPIGFEGGLVVSVSGQEKRVGIERLHLEEDAAKNLHQSDKTLIDFNRAGTPLVEIVTKPDFRSPRETKEFLQELRLMARYLGVSDADMEKGHLRVDANISLRPEGDIKFYPKTEIKNINSFRSVERALEFEVKRQFELWNEKKAPSATQTRGWDEGKQKTVEQRTKEDSADYRYFPEPDLPGLEISDELLAQVRANTPELPHQKRHRFMKEYGLSAADVKILVNNREWAAWFESVMSDLKEWLEKPEDNIGKLSKLVNSWITTEIFARLSEEMRFSDIKFSAENFAELIKLLYEKKINSTAGQKILDEMMKTGDDPSLIAEKLDLAQIDDDSTLDDLVVKVVMLYPEQVAQYKAGKVAVLKFLMGKVMTESKGKANPQKVEEILKEKLK